MRALVYRRGEAAGDIMGRQVVGFLGHAGCSIRHILPGAAIQAKRRPNREEGYTI
jgi:hypothetical protein